MKSSHIFRRIYSTAHPLSVDNGCVQNLNIQARFCASVNALKAGVPVVIRNVRYMCVGPKPSIVEPMTEEYAKQLIMTLTAEERIILHNELEKVHSHEMKAKFEG